MNAGRVVVSLAWTYVIALIVVAGLTILWLVAATSTGVTAVAGLWFAVAGFGTVVIAIVALLQASRR